MWEISQDVQYLTYLFLYKHVPLRKILTYYRQTTYWDLVQACVALRCVFLSSG